MSAIEKILEAKRTTQSLRLRTAEERTQFLARIAQTLDKERKKIVQANLVDLKKADEDKLNPALMKRLNCDNKKVDEMCAMLASLQSQEDLLHKIVLRRELSDGLILSKRLVPLGTIGMIFESRPDALLQIAALCLRTANAVVLKGGSESKETNRVLYELILHATKGLGAWIQNLEDRIETDLMIRASGKEAVDLLIPRGSNSFVSYILRHARVPVIGHADGVCHAYIHSAADIDQSISVILDAKLQYPAVCNALECLLIDARLTREIPTILDQLSQRGVEILVDSEIADMLHHREMHNFGLAQDEDWGKEHLSNTLSVKIVQDLNSAIDFINEHGSGHTDIILTEDEQSAKIFQNTVDSSSIMWNCSSRFADGYRYGLGAELGISTSKIHARGPVGAEGLYSTQWILEGEGHIVAPFVDGTQCFSHKDVT